MDYALTIGLFAMLALLASRFDHLATRTAHGKATVNDGDTLTLGQERIRLRGIDAPEYNQICQRKGEDYACGRQARNALVSLIGDRTVSCSGWERDRYGRLLGVCTAGDVDLNAALVAAGWAVAYGAYSAEEQRAREAGAGIWAGSFQEPRDWRDAEGKSPETRFDSCGGLADWLRALFRLR